ncbi:MAG: hypothetical protein OEZ58_03100 [Gammaproteobacteria bacterium]|nr:hypothetical protein [Gammaproteobacteria bacterium]
MIVVDSLADVVEDAAYNIEAYCHDCHHHVKLPIAELLNQYGDLNFDQLRQRLRCSACSSRNVSIRLSYKM